MNQEIKKQWVEALRNGKYLQGSRYLCQVHVPNEPVEDHNRAIKIDSSVRRYCCLGVLEDILQSKTGNNWEVEEGNPLVLRIVSGAEGFIFESASCRTLLEHTSVLTEVAIQGGYGPTSTHLQTQEARQAINDFVKAKMPEGTPRDRILNIMNSSSLATLNDNNVPFDVIADVIEKFF